MKKSVMLLGNIVIVLVILGLTMFDVSSEQKRILTSQIEGFENMTVAMERVTTNYLLGEQQVCNSWASYINSNDMTAEEAIDFVRESIAVPNVTAHILLTGDGELAGLSTASRNEGTDDYTVSYDNVKAFDEGFESLLDEDSNLNVTRAYTNPVNAIQSIGFCCSVHVRDEETGKMQDAVFLRIVPLSLIETKWVFPTKEYEKAEISLIDNSGDYIVRGRSFKNSNFYEFYQSYNTSAPDVLEGVKESVKGAPGVFEMLNSTGQRSILSHTRVNSTDDWIIVTMIPISEFDGAVINWTIVGIITIGLLFLLIFNLVIMMGFNRKLKTAVDSADRANRAKTDFLSTMSHDIRTPMNAIVGLTIITEKNADDATAVRENLHKISTASNHLLTLINDILDITKVESGKITLNPVTFSLEECRENLINISQPMVKEKNIEFTFNTDKFEHEYLYADQLRLNQIYINLLSNAIKYTEAGGKVEAEMLEESGSTDRTVRLTYTVSDTGIGMTPEFMEKMYQPFSRQIDSRVDTIQGTGLGLAITKKMIDLMDGTIDCVSEVGKGTTFTVTLEIAISDKPAYLTKQEAGEGEASGDDTQTTERDELSGIEGMKILVVEDNNINWEIISNLLQMHGVETERAENGKRAVEIMTSASKGDYDLIFMDVQMPVMNGIEATKAIRTLDDEWAAGIPIIAMTADAFSENISECMAAGMNGHIAKPIDLKLVQKEIMKAKEGKRS